MKYIYYDCECKYDPNLVGWKNYKSQELSVGVIGYPNIKKPNTTYDDNAKTVEHLLPSMDLTYESFYDPHKLYARLNAFIQRGVKVVGYNTILYDNNLIANLVGEINPEVYLDVAIGGNKGSTTWREVDNGYLTFLVNNKAGNWSLAEAILKYKSEQTTSTLVDTSLYLDNVKKILDDGSYDILTEIIKITGGRWASPFDLVCNLTLGVGKSNHGSNVPKLYAEGKIAEIELYCKHDVRLLWLLHKFIQQYKYVLTPQYKDIPNLTQYQTIKVPFDGSVKNISGEFIHLSVFE